MKKIIYCIVLISLMACSNANKPPVPATTVSGTEVTDMREMKSDASQGLSKVDTLQWIVILLIAMGAFGYVMYNNKKPKDENEKPQRKSHAEPKIIAEEQKIKEQSNQKSVPEPEVQNKQQSQTKEQDNGKKTDATEHAEAHCAETKDTDKNTEEIHATEQIVAPKPVTEVKKQLYVNEKLRNPENSYDPSFHVFTLTVDADGINASFEFHDNRCKESFLKNFNEDTKQITCEILGYGNPDTAVMLQPGRAKKENGKWVVDKKLVLEYK